MDLKKCSACQAMVDSQKAYCPDCGAAMDEEQKRESASEFDNLAKTQNLNSTLQMQFLDNLNLSFIFAKKGALKEAENKVEPEKESVNKHQAEPKKEPFKQPIEPQQESLRKPIEPEKKTLKQPVEPVIPKAVNNSPRPVATERPKAAAKPAAVNRTAVGVGKISNKTIYIIIGATVLIFIILFLFALMIAVLGYIYYWQR